MKLVGGGGEGGRSQAAFQVYSLGDQKDQVWAKRWALVWVCSVEGTSGLSSLGVQQAAGHKGLKLRWEVQAGDAELWVIPVGTGAEAVGVDETLQDEREEWG